MINFSSRTVRVKTIYIGIFTNGSNIFFKKINIIKIAKNAVVI